MLLDTVAGELGKPAFEKVLAAIAEGRVRDWEPRMRGLSLADRVQALKAVYGDGDPYMEVEKVRGGFRLIERNCPFLNIAMQRPALCSVTVSALSRLAGRARGARGALPARPRPLRFPRDHRRGRPIPSRDSLSSPKRRVTPRSNEQSVAPKGAGNIRSRRLFCERDENGRDEEDRARNGGGRRFRARSGLVGIST